MSEPLASPVLIDRYLPSFDVREYHERRVPARPDQVYEIFRSLDLERSWVIRMLFAIRTLPSRFSSRKTEPTARQPFLESALAMGWAILEETPGQELVVGAVTQPWAPVVRFRGMPAPEFASFFQPGFTKIVWNIAVREADNGWTIASTETRVLATDRESRRRFQRYWLVVHPGIRLIRWFALRLLQKEIASRLPASSRRR